MHVLFVDAKGVRLFSFMAAVGQYETNVSLARLTRQDLLESGDGVALRVAQHIHTPTIRKNPHIRPFTFVPPHPSTQASRPHRDNSLPTHILVFPLPPGKFLIQRCSSFLEMRRRRTKTHRFGSFQLTAGRRILMRKSSGLVLQDLC